MKRTLWILALFAVSLPGWAAKKTSLAELKAGVASLKSSGKDDAAAADWLKQLELTEELPPPDRKELALALPGPLCNEQLDALAGRSAFLPPSAASLPADPALDAAAQKALLAKALDFAAQSNGQSPHLVVNRSAARFQDSVNNTSTSPGLVVNANYPFARLSEAVSESVEMDKGFEKPAPSKAKTKWGSNGAISEGDPAPSLNTALQDATATGKIEWARWETIGGRKAAVFTFIVDKKKAHYTVNYCCFPETDIATGVAAMGTMVPVPGEIQSVTTWRPFKKQVSYHGLFYLLPETGAMVRMVLVADLKSSDFVHQEATRVDFGAFTIGGSPYVLPVNSYIFSEVAPNGGDSSRAYSVRHALFLVEYRDYRPASTVLK